MEYRLLGRTGISVSPLCLGTMMFGPWGNDDRADAIRVIHHALDAGINVVDTADVYSGGVSEEITGEALQGRRDASTSDAEDAQFTSAPDILSRADLAANIHSSRKPPWRYLATTMER